ARGGSRRSWVCPRSEWGRWPSGAARFVSADVTRPSSTPSTVSDRYISRAYPDAWEIDGKMCGIIGVTGVPDAARVAYLGLYSLQHRGQESGGMVAVDGEGVARSHRGMGLVCLSGRDPAGRDVWRTSREPSEHCTLHERGFGRGRGSHYTHTRRRSWTIRCR